MTTLKLPSVTDRLLVDGFPGTGTIVNANVPVALVAVNVDSVMVPLPKPTPACHPWTGLPVCRSAFDGLSGPNVQVLNDMFQLSLPFPKWPDDPSLRLQRPSA